MDPRLISSMTADEIRDGLWLVSVFERSGGLSPAEAAEWRRRILARQAFLELDGEGTRGC